MVKRHVEYEQLIAYAAGILSADEAAMVELHLATHPEDALTVARYRTAQQRLASDDSEAPSAEALARAKAIFHARPGERQASWLDAVDRFVARLIFDSRLQPLAVRSVDAADLVNMTFATDEAEIDVQVERHVDAMGQELWQLMGQVSFLEGSADDAAIAVAATRHGERIPLADGVVDRPNTFTCNLGGLAGAYDLYIRTSRGTIVLPKLRIG